MTLLCSTSLLVSHPHGFCYPYYQGIVSSNFILLLTYGSYPTCHVRPLTKHINRLSSTPTKITRYLIFVGRCRQRRLRSSSLASAKFGEESKRGLRSRYSSTGAAGLFSDRAAQHLPPRQGSTYALLHSSAITITHARTEMQLILWTA